MFHSFTSFDIFTLVKNSGMSVYVHVHMFLHVWMCKDAHTSIWTGRWNLDDTKNNESSFIDLELTRIQKHQQKYRYSLNKFLDDYVASRW